MADDLTPSMYFGLFEESDHYERRLHAIRVFRPVARELLGALVKKSSITDVDLDGLIQLLRFRKPALESVASKEQMRAAVAKYVPAISSDSTISDRLKGLSTFGYTGVGKASVNVLTPEECKSVLDLLKGAFEVATVAHAKTLVDRYDAAHVPAVTKGIYSPWLHYINTALFPIVTKKSERFFPKNKSYSEIIDLGQTLLNIYGQQDLGIIDAFAAWHWDRDEKQGT